MGGLPAPIGFGASLFHNVTSIVGITPPAWHVAWINGVNPSATWAWPQPTAFEDREIFALESEALCVGTGCSEDLWTTIWGFTGLEEGTGCTMTETLTTCATGDTNVFAPWEFFLTPPGVNTTVICGTGFDTSVQMYYDDVTAATYTGLEYGLGYVPVELVPMPGVSGDNEVVEISCNCTFGWESTTNTIESYTFEDINHSQLLWNPSVLSVWLPHATDGPLPTVWAGVIWLSGVVVGRVADLERTL